ncbi:MAG: hypothetical protein ACE5GT_07735 [Rhodospirillales bacterium]
MNTISETVNPWRASTELAIAPSAQPETGPRPGDDAAVDDGFEPFGEDGFTFLDFIDIINPLHHIPVIGTLYRQFSGDTIDPASRVLGGTLFFGPVGTVASVANVLIEEGTGKDVGEHVVAFLDDREPDGPQAPDAQGEVVADVGVRANPSRPMPIDPVTAWAMSEVAYRKSAAEKIRSAPGVGDTADGREPAVPVTLSALGAGTDGPRIPETGAAAGPRHAWASLTSTAPAPVTVGLADAAGAVRDARSAATLFQATAFGLGRPQAAARSASPATDAAPGAIGRNGGWFPENMLTVLERYDDGAGLTGAPSRTAIDITR